MRKGIIFLGSLFMIGFAFIAFSAGEPPEKVSIETMFHPGFQAKLSTPKYIWLENGNVFLLDSRVEPGKRTFEVLEPGKGSRTPIVEASKILTAFKKHLGEEAPEVLKWPDAVDPMGRRIIYILAGDLFLVEFPAGEVKRLTQTPSEETFVTFSPDGERISFTRDNDIYAVERETGNEKRLTIGGTDTLLNGPLSWVYWEELYNHAAVPYAWSPDSRSIAYLQSDDSPVSVSTFVHFKPVTQGVVRQRYPKAGQANPKVRLGIVDITSAKTTWMDCGDYEYLARFNWLPDSKDIAVQTLNRKQSLLKLLLADKQTGKSQLILEEKHPAWINLNKSLYFFKKKKQFIWSSERDDYRHLYLYRLDGQLVRQLTKGNFQIVSSSRGLLSGAGGLVGVDEKRGFVYFTSNRKSLRERHLYRVKMNGKGLKRLSTGTGVHAVWFSPGMTYYLDTYSNTKSPPELVLYNADGSKRKVVTPSAKEVVKAWDLVPPEFHTFKADDGLELAVMMTKAPHFDKTKKYPAIVYVYGGPVSQQVVDYWRIRWTLWPNLLGREGYFTFVVEVRAGAGINRTIETSVYKQAYGKQNVKDILAAVKWIKQMPFIDPGRIGIWGGSGGGCTTIYTMTHTDTFKAGISLYPVSDWRFYDTIYTERFLSTPQDNPGGYRDTSAVDAAGNLHGRLLIVHGTYDDNVHPQNTWAFINRLIADNIQFDLMIYPWRKHGIRDYPARVHLYTLILNFWKKYL